MGHRRLITGCIVAIAALMPAGCGSTKPSTTTQGRQPRTTSTIAARSPCTNSGEVRPGVLDAFRMGAVDFSSMSDGVGLSSGEFNCFTKKKGARPVEEHSSPEQLAVTRDGGNTWTLTGVALPRPPAHVGRYGQFVVAVSASTDWVVSSAGRPFLTTDGGHTWTPAPIPVPVVSLQARDGYLWALSCSHLRANRCRPVVSRRKLTASGVGGWATLPLPMLVAGQVPGPVLALLPKGNAVLSATTPGTRYSRLVVSSNAGARWQLHQDPDWSGRPCVVAYMTTSGPDIWLLCLGGAAAGSSAKALLFSGDGATSWQVRSSVADLSKPSSPSAIPRTEPSGLIATTSLKLWMGLQFGIATSGDGGRSWYDARSVSSQGVPVTFDAVSPSQVYALAPGAGLWRSTDGIHWSAIGPLNTG